MWLAGAAFLTIAATFAGCLDATTDRVVIPAPNERTFRFEWAPVNGSSTALIMQGYIPEHTQCDEFHHISMTTDGFQPLQYMYYYQNETWLDSVGSLQYFYGLSVGDWGVGSHQSSDVNPSRPFRSSSYMGVREGPTNFTMMQAVFDVRRLDTPAPSLVLVCDGPIQVAAWEGIPLSFSSQTMQGDPVVSVVLGPSVGAEVVRDGHVTFQAQTQQALLLVYPGETEPAVVQDASAIVQSPAEIVHRTSHDEDWPDLVVLRGGAGQYSVSFEQTGVGSFPLVGMFLDPEKLLLDTRET